MKLTFGRLTLVVCCALALNGAAARAQLKAAPKAGPQLVPNATIRKIARGVFQTGVASLTLNPDAVFAGQSSTITVEILTAAPASGTRVLLSAAPATLATLPPSITIAAAQTTGTFLVSTNAGVGDGSVTIGASVDGLPGALTAALKVVAVPTPISVQSLTLPATVPAWSQTTATVTLSGAAGSTGTTVALSSSNPSVLHVPASVLVPAGQKSQAFTVTGASFAASGSAALTANVEALSKSVSTTVLSGADIVAFSGFPKLLKVGTSVTGAVRVAGVAPAGGVTIPLSFYSNATNAVVPSSVTIPAGQSQGPVTVSASQYGGFISLYRSAADQAAKACNTAAGTCAAIEVVEPPQFQALNLCPSNLVCSATSGSVEAGVSMQLQVYVWAWPDPTVVTLSSSNPQVASVAPSVTFQGEQGVTELKVTTSAVSTPTSVTITGTCASCVVGAAGLKTRSVTLQVIPAVAVGALSLPQADIKGGTATTGTVTLAWPAGSGGAKVNLTSSNPSLCGVPASMTIPAGQTTGTFAVTTQPVAAAATVTVAATYATTPQKTATLRITP